MEKRYQQSEKALTYNLSALGTHIIKLTQHFSISALYFLRLYTQINYGLDPVQMRAQLGISVAPSFS